jgi:hypothetical protein
MAATDYEKLEVDDLAKRVEDRDLKAEGTGKDGAIVKADLIKALEDADAAEAAAAENAGDATKFTVERLIEDSYDLTGYPRHYAAGALYGRKSDMTASAAKGAIERWLKGDVE